MHRIYSFILAFFVFHCGLFAAPRLVVSSSAQAWGVRPTPHFDVVRQGLTCTIEFDAGKTRQRVSGFGVCYDEVGWKAIQVLAPERREEILREFFRAGVACGFTHLLIPAREQAAGGRPVGGSGNEEIYPLFNYKHGADKSLTELALQPVLGINPGLSLWTSDLFLASPGGGKQDTRGVLLGGELSSAQHPESPVWARFLGETALAGGVSPEAPAAVAGEGCNSWSSAFQAWALLKRAFDAGGTGYCSENPILDETCLNGRGQKGASLITVVQASRLVQHNPEFYMLRHFSQFVSPGARVVVAGGRGADKSLCFVNPDGSCVVVVANPSEKLVEVQVVVDGMAMRFELPEKSFATVGF